ncbi:MAG: cytochrome c oxidase subunit II [Aggregatilineales bacterium]
MQTTQFLTPMPLPLQINPPYSLDPRGPGAAHIADLWWIMFFLGTAIFLLVAGLMFFGLFGRQDQSAPNEQQGLRWIMLGGIVMPAIVLLVVFGITIRSAVLNANEVGTGEITVEVVGHRWWWEVHYPEHSVVTANEIHLPVGVPVEFILRSNDVIHSFWVPQLGGKMDLIPGRQNTLILQADEAGIYRGECAEFCGLQHARMHFMVIAHTTEEFEQWIESQQAVAVQPQGELARRGEQVFISAGCVYCHTIDGLDDGAVDRSDSDLGPNLTHLASRTTIAAGTLENNRGNLSGWIANPHGIKPGVLMPATLLPGEDLQALVTYLETLQ